MSGFVAELVVAAAEVLDEGVSAPRGAVQPCGGERTPLPTRRSGLVKLRAA